MGMAQLTVPLLRRAKKERFVALETAVERATATLISLSPVSFATLSPQELLPHLRRAELRRVRSPDLLFRRVGLGRVLVIVVVVVLVGAFVRGRPPLERDVDPLPLLEPPFPLRKRRRAKRGVRTIAKVCGSKTHKRAFSARRLAPRTLSPPQSAGRPPRRRRTRTSRASSLASRRSSALSQTTVP